LTVLLLAPRADLTTPSALLLALTSLVALLRAQPEPLLAIAGLVVFPVAMLTVLLLASRALPTMLTALLLALTSLVALVALLMAQLEPLPAIAGFVLPVATLTVLLLAPRALLAMLTALLLALTSLVALLRAQPDPLPATLIIAQTSSVHELSGSTLVDTSIQLPTGTQQVQEHHGMAASLVARTDHLGYGHLNSVGGPARTAAFNSRPGGPGGNIDFSHTNFNGAAGYDDPKNVGGPAGTAACNSRPGGISGGHVDCSLTGSESTIDYADSAAACTGPAGSPFA